MKKLSILISVLFFSVVAFSQTNTAQEVRHLMKDAGYSESTTQYAYISEGKTAYHYKKFYSGNDYAIVAFPEDEDVYDVDLYLYDDDGTLLAKSSSDDLVEVIKYSPYTTREMKVVVKNYDSSSSTAEYKVKFMIFYK